MAVRAAHRATRPTAIPPSKTRARSPARRATLLGAVVLGVLLASTGAAAPWHWPLRGQPQVAGEFDPPQAPWHAGHRGIDLRAGPGEPVLAAGTGRIVYAGMVAGRGVVSITHGKRRTTYEPVVPAVHTGETVTAGERIGVLARQATHCSPDSCLHWGLRIDGSYRDPRHLLGHGPIRLLPVWDVPRPYAVAPAAVPLGQPP